MRRRTIAGSLLATGLLVGTALGPAAGPAVAQPSTVTSFPAGAVGTTFKGRAFDTCEAPSAAAMQAWEASPYRAVGVYIGGINRACDVQANLTSSWMGTVSSRGWRVIPIYVGRQAPCMDGPRADTQLIRPTTARTLGTIEAADAVKKAKAVGLRAGSAVYADIESYSRTDASCRVAVLQYLSGWTTELHRQGFVSAVYGNITSAITDLSAVYPSRLYARPDAVWGALWRGGDSLVNWAGVSNTRWTAHQRGRQYLGDHFETWGGVRLRVDSDSFDGPVGTVALTYSVTAPRGLNARSGPATSYPVVRGYSSGSALAVVCQAPGATIGSTKVWDRLADGSYVSDLYVSTPSNTTYSRPLQVCRYPYQVAAAPSLRKRKTASSSGAWAGSIWDGGLAWVTCQQTGSKVGTTSVWDKLEDGAFVSDYYVLTLSNRSWTPPIPHC